MGDQVQSPKLAAVLAANAAMSSILTMMLRECPGLRVRQFLNAGEVLDYAKIAPVDILVCDFQLTGDAVPGLVRELRQGKRSLSRSVKVIALVREVDRSARARILDAGIDEIIVKPMSPAHIKERVMVRLGLAPQPAPSAVATLRPRPRIVPLFAEGTRPSAEIIDFMSRRNAAQAPEIRR
jgi:DNA-binding response OmpR family regulator